MKAKLGFTLVEIIVVVSVISILASMLVVGMVDIGKRSRDSDRQADLRLMQNAIELYKNKYGRYPDGCNGANRWSAQTVSAASANRCTNSSQEYIEDLAPEFMPALPKELKPNGDNSGYMYYVNADGSTFKLVAYRTVESEVVTLNHAFKPCDSSGVCNSTASPNGWGGNTPPACQPTDSRFQTSYAVSGGYPNEPFTSGPRAEEKLEAVICQIP